MNWPKDFRLVQVAGNSVLFLLLCLLGYYIAPEAADDQAESIMWFAIMLHVFLVLEKKYHKSQLHKKAWSYAKATYRQWRGQIDFLILGPVVGGGAKGVVLEEAHEINVTGGKTACLVKADVWRSVFGDAKGSELGDYSLSYLVLAVKLDVSTPHIFIDGRSQNRFGRKNTDLWSLAKRLSRSEKIADLEGDFYKYFDVYAADKKYLNALTIVTPDVMLELKEQGYSFDYEIYDGCLYVIHENHLSSPEEMQVMIAAMQNCLQELIPQITKHTYDDAEKQLEVSSTRLHAWAVGISITLILKYFIKVVIFVVAGFAIGEYLRNV